MKKIILLSLLCVAFAFVSCKEDGTTDSEVIQVTGVTLNKSTLSLLVDAKEQLVANILPENATDKTVTWSSSDSSTVSVDSNGLVTGVKVGTATITVTTNDSEKTSSATVTVTDSVIAVTGVNLNKSTLSLDVDAKETLTATITPENATNKNVVWSTSDANIATVSQTGEVLAVNSGTATITVTTDDGGKTAACTVTVIKPVVVTINRDSILLGVDEKETLTATISTRNADVTWSSENEAVAKVDDKGEVTAMGLGETTIKATVVGSNETATCKVFVEKIIVNYIGANWAAEPSFFAKMNQSNGCVTFTPSVEYRLGTDAGSNSASALVYNKSIDASKFKVKLTISGGSTTLSVGYMANLDDISSYVEAKEINYNSEMPYYTINDVVIPANGYFSIYYNPKQAWYNIGISRVQVFVKE